MPPVNQLAQHAVASVSELRTKSILCSSAISCNRLTVADTSKFAGVVSASTISLTYLRVSNRGDFVGLMCASTASLQGITNAGGILCSSTVTCNAVRTTGSAIIGSSLTANGVGYFNIGLVSQSAASIQSLVVSGLATFYDGVICSSAITCSFLRSRGNITSGGAMSAGGELSTSAGFRCSSAASIQSLNVATSIAAKTLSTALNTVAASYASLTVDLSASQIHWIDLHVSVTGVSLQNAVSGTKYNFFLKQAQASCLTVWPGFLFAGGAAPTLSTAQNSVDCVSAIYDGTSFYAVSNLNFA